MLSYPKIQTVWKRDMTTLRHPLIPGNWTCPEFQYLAECEWAFTEKVDGVNIHMGREPNDAEFKVCGRNDTTELPSFIMDALMDRYVPGIKTQYYKKLDPENPPVLYGEAFGPRIQKGGGNYGDCVQFALFDIRVGKWWLRRDDVEAFADGANIPCVPVIEKGSLYRAIDICAHEKRLRSKWGSATIEGIVARPTVPLLMRNGNRIITKIKYCDFEVVA